MRMFSCGNGQLLTHFGAAFALFLALKCDLTYSTLTKTASHLEKRVQSDQEDAAPEGL